MARLDFLDLAKLHITRIDDLTPMLGGFGSGSNRGGRSGHNFFVWNPVARAQPGPNDLGTRPRVLLIA